MGEVAERARGVVARTAGNIVNPAVTGFMAAAGVITGNVELAVWSMPLGALSGSLTEEGVNLIGRAWQDRADRVATFARQAAETLGVSEDELLNLAAQNDQTRRLTGITVQAATEARDEWKLAMLAKVFAGGATDPARVDEAVQWAELSRKVHAPHARMLAVFYRNCGKKLEPVEKPDWVTVRQSLRLHVAEIIQSDPGLENAVHVVAAELAAANLLASPPFLELTMDRDNSNDWVMTSLGFQFAAYLNDVSVLPGKDGDTCTAGDGGQAADRAAREHRKA